MNSTVNIKRKILVQICLILYWFYYFWLNLARSTSEQKKGTVFCYNVWPSFIRNKKFQLLEWILCVTSFSYIFPVWTKGSGSTGIVLDPPVRYPYFSVVFFFNLCFFMKKYAFFNSHFHTFISTLGRLLHIDKNFVQNFCVWRMSIC